MHVGRTELVAGRASADFIGVSTTALRGGRIFYLMLWPNRLGFYVGWIG